jgi:hypothetical protein
MKLFRKIRMEGSYWGVYIVNSNDNADRYLVSSTFDSECDAENLASELNRIAEGAAKVGVTDSIPILQLNNKRRITLED